MVTSDKTVVNIDHFVHYIPHVASQQPPSKQVKKEESEEIRMLYYRS
jgi:hypothetical protein